MPTPSHSGSTPHVTGPGRVTWPSRAPGRRLRVAADGWGEGPHHMTMVGRLPTRPVGAAMLGAELPVACLGGFGPPVPPPLATSSGAAALPRVPRPLRTPHPSLNSTQAAAADERTVSHPRQQVSDIVAWNRRVQRPGIRRPPPGAGTCPRAGSDGGAGLSPLGGGLLRPLRAPSAGLV